MTPAPPAPGPPRPSSASPPGAAPRRREGERGPRAAGEAAEMSTEWVAQKATPGEGKAQRNRELGDWRGQPAGAHMSGKWHRRLRVGCRPKRVGLGRGPLRPGGKGMENWGRGYWGRGEGEGREGGGRGRGKRRVALCAGALGVCPGKGAGGRGQRRAKGHDDSGGLRAQHQGRRGRGSRRARSAGPEWPPPPRGRGLLAAKERGCSPCSWASHSDRRHFTAQRAPSSRLPSSSSPLTVLPVVTCIHFPGIDGPSTGSNEGG